jgi:hypothetical protein
MLRGNRELWSAFLAIIMITAIYGIVLTTTREIPPASELFGHGMGIVGFVFMLMTETLYSLHPAIYKPRLPEFLDSEIDQFLGEIKKLSGVGQRLSPDEIESVLKTLIADQNIRKATVWNTQNLQQLKISNHLASLGIELISPNAGKHEMAQCDLGITESDYLLPETGTIVRVPPLKNRVPFLCFLEFILQLSVLQCCEQICIRSLPKRRMEFTWSLLQAQAVPLILS